MRSATAYRVAVGLALTAVFLMVWLNAAAGLIGIEDDDPANLVYVAILAIGGIGALVARLQPRGLSITLLLAALGSALAGAVALVLPNTAGPAQILLLHTLFVFLFGSSAFLFRRAAR